MIMICNKCNNENPSDSEFCQFCGEKISISKIADLTQKNKFIMPIIILSIALFISLGFNIYQNAVAMNAKKIIEDKSNNISSLYTDLNKANDQNYWFDQHAGIVLNNNTKYYHKYNCSIINKNEISGWIYNIELAQYKGYKPCPKCH